MYKCFGCAVLETVYILFSKVSVRSKKILGGTVVMYINYYNDLWLLTVHNNRKSRVFYKALLRAC